MEKNFDERFEAWKKGKSFNESIDNLKGLWWEKEGKPDLVKSIEQAMNGAEISEEKETFKIMKELLKATKVKKMEDYLNDG